MTRPSKPWPVLLVAALIGWTSAIVIGIQPWLWVDLLWTAWGGPVSPAGEVLQDARFQIDLAVIAGYGLFLAIFACGTMVLALASRSPRSHKLLNYGIIATYFLLITIAVLIRNWYGAVLPLEIGVDGEMDAGEVAEQVRGIITGLMAWFIWPGLALGVLHVLVNTDRAWAAFGRAWPDQHAPGSAIIESLRSGGSDRRYRGAWYGSFGVHGGVILITLISFGGCIRPYILPPGSGTPATPEVVAKKVEKKKEVLLLAKDSPIIFERPEITDSQVVENIQKESEKEYTATSAGAPGALGEGGGTEGGWPDGLPGGELRFIRISHNGGGWDDGMKGDRDNADRNFLARLKKNPAIKFPVASRGEANTIAQLQQYPKGFAPPFVYFTGDERFQIRGNETKALREFLQEGSLLFADAGSREFHNSFVNFARALFPGKPLVPIPDDDPIFQTPYQFPNGIQPLWPHGPPQAHGIKHKGRWVVFYHPGDVNDCWKDDAIRVDEHIRQNAFDVGYNVIYYGITKYLEATRKYRKK